MITRYTVVSHFGVDEFSSHDEAGVRFREVLSKGSPAKLYYEEFHLKFTKRMLLSSATPGSVYSL